MDFNNKTEFICNNCGEKIQAMAIGDRNHCPYCLYSLHTDIFPGDNAHECKGLMKPIGVERNDINELILFHSCNDCGKIVRTKVFIDDNFDLLLSLMKNEKK